MACLVVGWCPSVSILAFFLSFLFLCISISMYLLCLWLYGSYNYSTDVELAAVFLVEDLYVWKEEKRSGEG